MTARGTALRTLGINTCSAACDIALVEDGNLVAQTHREMARGQDSALPEIVTETLQAANISLSEIDRIAVVAGPGSFTGVRIGVAFARGLGLVTRCPVIGVSSLEAAHHPDRSGRVRVALIARRRPPDISFWIQDIEGLQALAPPCERDLADVSGPIVLLSDRPDLLDGAEPAVPSARLAAIRAARLDPATHPARPLYVRPPDADLPAPRK